ncbi:MAG: LOG family protein [Candidatus Aminicenantes bacterium]|nr:LOG family protein [Candidatus Aminicenantes bacterium]
MKKIVSPLKAYQNRVFLNSPEGRIVRILSEYIEPLARFEKNKINSTVLFLGSARADPADRRSALNRYYWEAEELAYRIARWAIPLKPKGKNFVVCTGAGPGIMEAANRGAARAGGKSVGMNISIPFEQFPNAYIPEDLAFVFHYFFMRKFWLVSRARAVVAFPGGYGTLDEFFEVITLLQTGKIERNELVLVLYGEEYWREAVDFEALARKGAISPEDVRLFTFFSDPGKAFAFLKKHLCRTTPGICL